MKDILYHIGLFEEAPSVLYNAILNYTSFIGDKRDTKGSNSISNRNLRALVVEDYEMNRILIEEMLVSFRINPDFALNGKDAISMVDKHRYDIIFMDINMPIMNGVDATKIFERKRAFKHPIY